MKAKVDKSGYLWLERVGKLKPVWCPYTYRGPADDMLECGEWCPLFRVDSPHQDVQEGIYCIEIELCRARYVIDRDDFIDERGEK
ncbi:MAG: hypothetical protein GXO75_08400 [Calditrichaeota bacterium]|nr:hypothetical protein [Calditrichota bacterium]